MTRPLDIATLPLRGRRLIEASAGTGKTFTLAALYVRLVLGHGGAAAYPQPLMPPDILVVTFTQAATDELRSRIRGRLRDARDVMLGHATPDAVLVSLLEALPREDYPHHALRLDQAMRMMDDASIFTIHGFCQRMLKRHAFDSGMPFQAELVADGKALFLREVEDYWRRQFYPLPAEAQALIQAYWPTPDALGQAVSPLMSGGRAQPLLWGEECVTAPATLADIVTSALAQTQQCQQALEAARAVCTEAAIALLEEAVQQQRLKANQFVPADLADKCAALRAWAAAPEMPWPDSLWVGKPPQAWCGQARLQRALKKNADPVEHPFFEALDAWQALLDTHIDITPQVLAHARDGIMAALEQRKRADGAWDFDDLLNALDDALHGQSGTRLARQIRNELPVALIDEFQDTDQVQYRIFDRLYPAQPAEQEGDKPTALLLIGDPKQAIYAFRNADLQTYLRARQEVDDHYTLMRNFRSTEPMVNAVNRVFSSVAVPFRHPDIPFVSVEAQGRKEQLVIDGRPATALEAWMPEGNSRVDKRTYVDQMSDAVRADVQHLLVSAEQGQTGFETPDGERVPVRPADIAILVRTGVEARHVRDALMRANIRSVYLSQKDSVFASTEAFWLLQLLEAVAHPRDDHRIRNALATRLLSDRVDDVAALIEDELRWESMAERFAQYHRDWQRVGVLAMIKRVMQAFDVSTRLLQRPQGERSLTDFLHLAELAQTAGQHLDGEQAVLRWLHRALSGQFDSGMDPEALTQRLESDEQLVKVITIHKSKGLEYPIVYLPFICDYRQVEKRDAPFVVQHPSYGRVVAAEPPEAICQWADQARLDEDIRLLYVALTRARHACRMGVAPLYKSRGGRSRQLADTATTLAQSALGTLLLDGDETLDSDQLRARLEALAEARILAVVPLPETSLHPVPPANDSERMQCRRFTGTIDRHWWIASYSALLTHGEEDMTPSQNDDGLTLNADNDLEVITERTPTPAPPLGRINDFPRGPRAGNFLHALFEHLDLHRIERPDYCHVLLRDIETRLARAGYARDWAEPLHDWLMTLLTTPLHPQLPTLSLSRVQQWRTELEFWLPVARLSSQALDRLIRAFEPWPGRYTALGQHQLEGMMRGFIDAVLEHEGRWYVLDWKSNHLGDQGEDYCEAGMGLAMVKHRYDVQYVLYVLALHRLLRVRLPDYAYDRHMGGALYLFLRGVGPQSAADGQGVMLRRPDKALIERLDRVMSGEVHVDEVLNDG